MLPSPVVKKTWFETIFSSIKEGLPKVVHQGDVSTQGDLWLCQVLNNMPIKLSRFWSNRYFLGARTKEGEGNDSG